MSDFCHFADACALTTGREPGLHGVLSVVSRVFPAELWFTIPAVVPVEERICLTNRCTVVFNVPVPAAATVRITATTPSSSGS
jgi:hypothetical protein